MTERIAYECLRCGAGGASPVNAVVPFCHVCKIRTKMMPTNEARLLRTNSELEQQIAELQAELTLLKLDNKALKNALREVCWVWTTRHWKPLESSLAAYQEQLLLKMVDIATKA